MAWSRAFEDPIQLSGDHELRTLRDAAQYVMKLPGKTRQSEPWLIAVEALLMAAEDRGPLMHARIGMLRALNHGKPKPISEPRRQRARAYRIVK